jgi:2-polyprenyl-3-methyl-5-hydroxy-6-metoxy-1,4-benzoquinol methylase
VRWGRLGFTDVFHENVRRRGILGQTFILLFGTPHLGSFANGIYLKRILQRRQFSHILDAGCGDGTFAFYVASKHPASQVLGVDIGEQGLHGVETTLEVAERIQNNLQLPNLRFQRLDLRGLDSREAFDLAYSFDVLEHIAENETVLQNIYRALIPGGLLLLRIPTRLQKRICNPQFTAEHARWAAIEHVGQHHDMESLLCVVRAIGYRVLSAKHTTGFWGRLSFELSEALQFYRLPSLVQFACVPLLKLFRRIDTILNPTDGDGILVLCEK